MKVDINNIPDGKKSSNKNKFKRNIKKSIPSKKPQPVKKPAPETIKTEETADNKAAQPSGNVYVEGLKAYRDKFKASGLLQTNKFWIILLVVLFFVFLSVNSNASKWKNQLTVKLNRTMAETENLNGAIADVKADLEEQARIDSIMLSNDEEELARNDAKVQGNQVAYLQNKFYSFRVPADPNDSEATKTYIAEMNDNKKELDPYFDENGKRLGKSMWYSYGVGNNNGVPGKWEFATNASFKGDTVKVLWFCYANDPKNPTDHSLLAYTTAEYSASTKLFTNVVTKTTSYAEAKATGDNAFVPNDDETSVLEQFQGVTLDQFQRVAEENGVHTPPADEEYINEAAESRDDYKNKAANGEVPGEEYNINYNKGLPNQTSNGDSE